jgi:hypothetical protein
MSNVRYLKDRASGPQKRPCEVVFCGPVYRNNDRQGLRTFSVTVRVEDGDFERKLAEVRQEGGIGQLCEDGVFRFLPWPCAMVEVRDL